MAREIIVQIILHSQNVVDPNLGYVHVQVRMAHLGVQTTERSLPAPRLLVGVATLEGAELADGVGVTAKWMVSLDFGVWGVAAVELELDLVEWE